MKTFTNKAINGRIESVVVVDDYDFAGMTAPTNPNVFLQVVNTNVNIVTTLGWYRWVNGAWTQYAAGSDGTPADSNSILAD